MLLTEYCPDLHGAVGTWFYIKPNASNSWWPQTSIGSFVPCSINTNMVSSSMRNIPAGNVLCIFAFYKVSQLSLGARLVAHQLYCNPSDHLSMLCLFMKHSNKKGRTRPCLRLPRYLWSYIILWGGNSPLANTAESYCSCCRNSIREPFSAKGGRVSEEREARQCKESSFDSISP